MKQVARALALTIVALVVFTGCPQFGGVSNKPDAPSFSLSKGAYIGARTLEMSCATDGAVVKYTLDGGDPTLAGALTYEGPISISSTKEVRAVAEAAGVLSDIAVAQYLIFLWKGDLSSPPGDLVVGTAYYDTSLGMARFWDGQAWAVLSKDGLDGADGVDGIDGIDGIDGVGIVWQNVTTEPTSPELNWAYRNEADGISYIFDGTAWQVLAKDGSAGAPILWKGSSSEAPADPELNWLYLDTDDNTVYIWIGGSWETFVQGGEDGASGSAGEQGPQGEKGVDGVDGRSIVWQNVATEPTSPELNWAYRNEADGIAYIFDGAAWQILARDGTSGAGMAQPAPPSLVPPSGTYSSKQYAKLTSNPEGVRFYYTTDGSVPTDQSAEFPVSLTIDRTMALKVVAYKDGAGPSSVVTMNYELKIPSWRRAGRDYYRWNSTEKRFILDFNETTIFDSASTSRYSTRERYYRDGRHYLIKYSRDGMGRIVASTTYNVSASAPAPTVVSSSVNAYESDDYEVGRTDYYNSMNNLTSSLLNVFEEYTDSNGQTARRVKESYWMDFSTTEGAAVPYYSERETLEYGANGKLTGGVFSELDPVSGQPLDVCRMEYIYDASGRNTEIRYFEDGSNALKFKNTYSYDQYGNLAVETTNWDPILPNYQAVYAYEQYYAGSASPAGDSGDLESIGVR